MGTSVVPFQSKVPRRVSARTQPGDPTNINDQVGAAQRRLSGATEAFASGAQANMARSVGSLLGNLNAIGGIRSGGVKTGVQDIARDTAGEIGRNAAQTAVLAESAGQAAAGESQRRVESGRDFEFRGQEFAEGRRRFDTGTNLTREQMAASEKGRVEDMGFRQQELGSRETMARDDRSLRSRGMDLDATLTREGRAGEESRFSRDLTERGAERTQRGSQFDADLGFRRSEAERSGGQFDRDLGFRRSEAERSGGQFDRDFGLRTSTANEDRRRYELERQAAEKAARAFRRGAFLRSLGSIVGGVSGAILGRSGGGR